MDKLGIDAVMTIIKLILPAVVFVVVWGGIPALLVKALLDDNRLAKIAFALSIGAGIVIHIKTGQFPYGITFH